MEDPGRAKKHTVGVPRALLLLLAFSFTWIIAEVFYFMIVFNNGFFTDRIFTFQKPDYINFYLISYIIVSLVLRIFGLLNIARSKSSGLREFAFGQLMAIAIVARAIIKLTLFISIAKQSTAAPFNEMAVLIGLLLLEIFVLVCFYFFRKHPNQYTPRFSKMIVILTSVSLVGCFLNMLNIIHDIYLLSNKDYIAEYSYLCMLCVATFFSTYGLVLIREGNSKGFISYFTGQIIELVFYIAVLTLITIPGYTTHNDFDNSLANLGFIKNTIPLVVMSITFYFFRRSWKPGGYFNTKSPRI